MRVKKFQKRKEDFICENCNFKVKGDGFTNHCPECFYSKHVDIFPGDRLENCGSLMKPVDILVKKDGYIIEHECLKCGYKNRVGAHKNDNIDNLLNLAEKIAKEKFEKLDF